MFVQGQIAEEVEARVDTTLDRLKTKPIVTDAEVMVDGVPEIVTYSLVQMDVAATLFQPRKILEGLERDDATAIIDFYGAKSKPLSESPCGHRNESIIDDEYHAAADVTPFPNPISQLELSSEHYGIPEATNNASTAVLCTDGAPVKRTLEAAIETMNRMMNISKATGAVNAVTWLNCYGRKIKAKDRFVGAFGGNTRMSGIMLRQGIMRR